MDFGWERQKRWDLPKQKDFDWETPKHLDLPKPRVIGRGLLREKWRVKRLEKLRDSQKERLKVR